MDKTVDQLSDPGDMAELIPEKTMEQHQNTAQGHYFAIYASLPLNQYRILPQHKTRLKREIKAM